MKRCNGDQSVKSGGYSASGWFSGRARSKAGSARQAAVDGDDLGELVERHVEPPGVVDLRHQAEIGHRHGAAAGIGSRPNQRLQGLEAGEHPVMIPGVDRRLLLVQFALQVTQRADIVKWMDVAGDDFGDSARLRPRDRILRQQRRLRMRLVEIFDDGERLDQHVAGRHNQSRHAHLRVDGAEFGPPVMAAFLDQVHRHRLVGEALEIERDAHAISRRRAEIRIEFHVSPPRRLRRAARLRRRVARSARSAGSRRD